MLSVLLYDSLPYSSDIDSLTEPGGQQALTILLSLPPTVLELKTVPGFLCGFWGSELISSCLQSKQSNTMSHLPSPNNFFLGEDEIVHI